MLREEDTFSAASSSNEAAASDRSNDKTHLNLLNNFKRVQKSQFSFTRRIIYDFVNSDVFNYLILFVIIFNAINLGIETNIIILKRCKWYLDFLDNVFLGIYLWELIIKLYALRLSYFQSLWNNFDCLIILLSLITWFVEELVTLSTETSNILKIIRVFRAVRIIRFLYELKKVKFLRPLQIILEALFNSLQTILSIVCLAAIFLYVFAVSGVILYGRIDPHIFGSLGKSFVRLFQVMTLDRWSEIYTNNGNNLGIWVLAFALIILETFVFEKYFLDFIYSHDYSLFVAVIVNNLKSSRELTELKKNKKKRKDKKYGEDLGSNKSLDEGTKDNSQDALNKFMDEQHSIDNYYPPFLSQKLKESISNYFIHLAALDHASCSYQKQQKVLDDLIDIARKNQEKGFDY